VRVEYRRRPKAKFRLVAQVLTNELGYFSFRLPGRKPGKYRYRYTEPAGTSGVLTVRK
jgi:protocatechuate 3,4-dioxygenase beta subunit